MFTKTIRAALLLLAVSASHLPAQAADNSPEPSVGITWLGGASMVFEFNAFKMLTDPVLGEGKEAFTMGDPNEMFDLAVGPNTRTFKRLTPLPDINTTSFDLLLLSHIHEDHFDQTAQNLMPKQVAVITPPADSDKLKKMGFTRIANLEWGESWSFDASPGKVTITAVNARHSTAPEIDKILGRGNGYWIDFSQGEWKRSVYWTGDTFPTGDVVKRIQSLGKPDVLIPHIGAVGTTGPLGQITMDAEDVVSFAKKLSSAKVLPIHHSTFPLYLEPVSELVIQSHGQNYGLDVASPGTTLRY